MSAHIPQLFTLEPFYTDALDKFVGACLTSGGIWKAPRTSDGISKIDRVFERSVGSFGVCARIYEIDDQSLHTFWLEISRGADGIKWSLYFDPIGTSPRDYNAVHHHDRADDVEWRATLSGDAIVLDGVLLVVEKSTVASLQDAPVTPTTVARDNRRHRQ